MVQDSFLMPVVEVRVGSSCSCSCLVGSSYPAYLAYPVAEEARILGSLVEGAGERFRESFLEVTYDCPGGNCDASGEEGGERPVEAVDGLRWEIVVWGKAVGMMSVEQMGPGPGPEENRTLRVNAMDVVAAGWWIVSWQIVNTIAPVQGLHVD